jgi:hypothetical protein
MGFLSLDRLHYRRRDTRVILFAFDLIELNGDDLRRTPIEQRKVALARMLSRAAPRIQFNEHIEEDVRPCSCMRAPNSLSTASHLPPKGGKCYPCVRYEVSPMSQAAH